MPCDSVTVTRVSLQNLDRNMLKRALGNRRISFSERHNGDIVLTLEGRQVTLTAAGLESTGSRYDRSGAAQALDAMGQELKIWAAEQSVNESAAENGFDVSWETNEFGQRAFVLERESF